jgi:hypothetical protein
MQPPLVTAVPSAAGAKLISQGWDGLLPHYVAACTGGPHAAADLRPTGQ